MVKKHNNGYTNQMHVNDFYRIEVKLTLRGSRGLDLNCGVCRAVPVSVRQRLEAGLA